MRKSLRPACVISLLAAICSASIQDVRADHAWAAYQSAAVKAMEAKDYSKAHTLFSAALADAQTTGNHEQAAQSILGAATSLLDAGKYEEAHQVLTKAVEICGLHSAVIPKSRGMLRLALSHAHVGLGKHEDAAEEASQALAHFEQEVAADEEVVRTLAHLANLKTAQGAHHEAEALAAHAATISSNSPVVSNDAKSRAHLAHATALTAGGNHEAAGASLEKAKASAPKGDAELQASILKLSAAIPSVVNGPAARK